MKATELMIGDWVFWKNKPVQVVRISGIKYEFGHIDIVLAHCNDEGLLETHDISSIEPIPLTPEILEKNGFEKRYAIGHWEWVLFNERFSISIEEWLEAPSEHNYVLKYERTDILEPIIQLTLSYVHELQRAFRICGEYELADNFKL